MNIRSIPKQTYALLSRAYTRSKTRVIIAGILVLTLLGFGIYALISRTTAPAVTSEDTLRTVVVKSVSELTSGISDFSVVGNVQSESEATVRTESAGQVTALYHALGDNVGAGTIIAEMDNASQRAAVLQAQGGLQAAQANLAKASSGVRPEQLAILQSAALAARSSAVNALLGAYGSVDDTVHHTADLMFSNPDTYSPTFGLTVADSQLPITLKDQRIALTATIARERGISDSLSQNNSSASLHAEIALTLSDVRAARAFFDNLLNALDKAVVTPSVTATEIATYKASASAARSALTAVLSSLSGVDTGITAADQNLAVGTIGGATEDVAAAQAGVTSAQGGVAAARAQLEKTIIRAPISGTINMLNLKRGDFEQIYTPVVTIANNHALEIIAYVSEDDAKRIAVGDTVTLDSDSSGVITKIAPALDPSTKRIEVRIGVPNNTTLTNGQSVNIAFEHSAKPTSHTTSEMIIPLSALKISADSKSVFTVGTDGTLMAHIVTIGTLLGDRVVVLSGIDINDVIVTDARGLRAGEKVIIK